MNTTFSHIVRNDEAGERIDIFLFNLEWFSSRSSSANALKRGYVLVNNSSVKKNYIIQSGDEITFEDLSISNKANKLINIDLNILYEDQYLLVLSKQADLPVHGVGNYYDKITLSDILVEKYGARNLCNVHEDKNRLGIVHRLDADTSGLMICAKDDNTAYALIDEFKNRKVKKKYICLVYGAIDHPEFEIDAPIDIHPTIRNKRIINDSPTSKEAHTLAKVISIYENKKTHETYSLLEVELFTGRTHQIRVHMQYIKHPIVGDQLYTSYVPKNNFKTKFLGRQFLHSYYLEFFHPKNEKNMIFYDNLSEDLMKLLSNIDSTFDCVYRSELFENLVFKKVI